MIKGMTTKEYYTGHGPLSWLDELIQQGVERLAKRAVWRRQKNTWTAANREHYNKHSREYRKAKRREKPNGKAVTP